jgi:D-alanyl-D-alanine carboxypeptidase/D-alanyl-D-alanine-endopeptidase (penicillin-binding protein 4)
MREIIMKCVTLIFLAFISVQNNLFASQSTDTDWQNYLSKYGLPSTDQAYCYTDETGVALGTNINSKIRLASVSKLITTLWAVNELGAHYKYKTKLLISNGTLHIKGSFDPFFDNEKLYFLISQLNDLGYDHFDKISFDSNLLINLDARYHSEEYPDNSPVSIKKIINNYFNTANWSATLKQDFEAYRKIAAPGRIRANVNFSVTDVSFDDNYDSVTHENIRELTLASPEIVKYLKEMNIKSNNYIADTIFKQLGSNKFFNEFMLNNFQLNEDYIHFFSGSGLPVNINGSRFDNYSNCSTVVFLIYQLKLSLQKQNLDLENIVAVPGSDGGTFRNRTFPGDFKNTFVAKTGTLMHTSTLAGALNTNKGFSFFGIFNQTTDISSAKIVQNNMVSTLMLEMGGPKIFSYTPGKFNTYSDENVYNKLAKSIFGEEKFRTYSEDLY